MKLRTGDRVTVIAGADKGKEGKILKVLDDTVIVEGVHIVTKHLKPKYTGSNGEIVKTEAPIHRSNVKLVENAKKNDKKEDKNKDKKEKAEKKEKPAKDKKEAA